MFVSYVCKKSTMFFPWATAMPTSKYNSCSFFLFCNCLQWLKQRTVIKWNTWDGIIWVWESVGGLHLNVHTYVCMYRCDAYSYVVCVANESFCFCKYFLFVFHALLCYIWMMIKFMLNNSGKNNSVCMRVCVCVILKSFPFPTLKGIYGWFRILLSRWGHLSEFLEIQDALKNRNSVLHVALCSNGLYNAIFSERFHTTMPFDCSVATSSRVLGLPF